MKIEPGIEEAAPMPDAVASVATHTHGEDTSLNKTAAAPIKSQSPIMDTPVSLSMPTITPFPMNHDDGDCAASHADTLKNTPQSAPATDESNFVGMTSATDRLSSKQTQSNENASVQNTEYLGTNSSRPLPDGKGDHLPSRASRSKRTTKKNPKPAEARKKPHHKQEKQGGQEKREERDERFRKLRKELADDGGTVQDNDDEHLKDLTEDFKICEGELLKLNRTYKQGPLTQDELRDIDELPDTIAKLRKDIHELEMSKRSALKNTLPKTAREFWERLHAAGPKESLAFAKKIRGTKRKRGQDTTGAPGGKKHKGGSKTVRWGENKAGDTDDGQDTTGAPGGKKHKGGSKTVRWGENKAGDTDDGQDSRQALAKALGIQDQQDISLENKTKLFQQLTSKKARGSVTDPRAKDQLQVLKHATSSFGFKGCSLEKEKSSVALNLMRWRIKSFKSQLYNHQVVGVSWMLSREFSPLPPHGGILSDAMGLGKTVQILACMAHNPPLVQEYPEDHEYKTRATLIIAPASAINQWRSEIEVHTPFKPVLIYKKTGAASMDRELWMKTSIVLVSYEEVVGALPPKPVLDEAKGVLSDVDQSLVGDLFKVQFHRIVADEAHKMKNHNSRTSIACAHLRAKYRWAVTGTPILNRLQGTYGPVPSLELMLIQVEMYAFLRFLKIEPGNGFEDFRRKFKVTTKDNEELTEEQKTKIGAIRDEIMLRRTANESFLGSPILNIPDIAESKDVILEMSSEEAIIIKHHQEEFRQMVNDWLEPNGEGVCPQEDDNEASVDHKKRRGYMLSRISHMRQLSAHLFLGDQLIRTFWKKEAFDRVIPQLPQSGSMTNSVLLNQLKKYQRKAEDESQTSVKAPMGPQMCGSCDELPTRPHMTACKHIFCHDCIMESSSLYAEIADIPCLVCGEDIGKLVPVKASGQGPSQNKSANVTRGQRHKAKQETKPREYGEDVNGVRLQSNVPNGFLQLNDIYYKLQHQGRTGVGESSKLNAALQYIRRWQAEAPDDKIIVLTQWVGFGMILGRKLQEEGIGFLYFFGNMGMDTRNRAVSIFKDDKNAKVLVAGFSCTGVALNLTCANRVIHTDLWWNKGLEDQANGRVLRIGQEKNTYFVRLLLKDTLDEGIKELQETKTKECAPLMEDERALRQARKLSMRQVSSLFGAVRKVDGNLVIVNEDRPKRARKSRRRGGESEEEEMDDADETEDDNEWSGSDGGYEEESDESSGSDGSGTSEEED